MAPNKPVDGVVKTLVEGGFVGRGVAAKSVVCVFDAEVWAGTDVEADEASVMIFAACSM